MARYRILVTGSSGQLGSEIRNLRNNYPYNFYFTDTTELDITDKKGLSQFVRNNKVNTIINCAAYTAVDTAEVESEKAFLVNSEGSKYLAEVAIEEKCKLIHISTDYVFDGKLNRPYVENDATFPQSVYGHSKLEGENFIKKINPLNSIIIRTSWVYSSFGNNFVKTMLRISEERDELNVVSDQVGSPTYAKDLARTILQIVPHIDNKSVEVYHYSNDGVCSWYDFAKAIFDLKNVNCVVHPIPSSKYPTPAVRPYYSVLNKSAIKDKYKISVPYWRDSLKSMLKDLFD